MDMIDICKWRYATKKMDPSKKLSAEKLERILEVIRLAPSSSGLQPFHIFDITSPELRAQIKSISKDQTQIVDCSHLLVFAAWDTYTDERINQVFDHTNAVRGATTERWENYRQMLLGKYPVRSAEENFQHTARQAYVALAFGVMAAANEGVDCTPIEGFDPTALDELLNLREQGLRSVVMLPLGYRDEATDWIVNLKKARRPKKELVTEIA